MHIDPLGFLAQTIMFGSVPRHQPQSSLLTIERSISCRTVGSSPAENTVLDYKSNLFHDFLVVYRIQQPNFLCNKYLVKHRKKLPVVEKLAVDVRPKPFAHPVSPTSLLSSIGRHIGMMFKA